MQYADDLYVAATGADALLILSDWSEFGELDLDKLQDVLRYPIVIDGRNLYDPQQMLERGFTYLSVGRPAMYPAKEKAEARRMR
jgi:UDPglucose 6-dehydrogenase